MLVLSPEDKVIGAFFVLLFVQIPEPNANASTEPIGQLMKGALKFRHFVLGAIAIFVYVGIEVGVPGTLNLFLTDPVEKGGAVFCAEAGKIKVNSAIIHIVTLGRKMFFIII